MRLFSVYLQDDSTLVFILIRDYMTKRSCEAQRLANTKATTQQDAAGRAGGEVPRPQRQFKPRTPKRHGGEERDGEDDGAKRPCGECPSWGILLGYETPGVDAEQGGLALQQYWRRALPGMGMPEASHTPAENLPGI
ncbi:hypothetical protein FQN60_017150 [Etheostoma spectabile]|uniref:Uncharacterized protein n=1 Tax=Etheostoma spectabile TaxID=54343 RepID=A0A5J5DEP7_9PERO|nr:hypothetical protein FQN60_017150 [Etheostoma spectabile]